MNSCICAFMISAFALGLRAQELAHADSSSTRPAQVSSFIAALVKVATQFKLPLAVEWVQSPETLKPVRLPDTGDASSIIDALVSSRPGYSWNVQEGVVHVFQESIVNDPRNPLNVRLDALPDHPWTLVDVDNFLFSSVAFVARSVGPKQVAETPPGWDEPRFRLSTVHAPVHEILDRLITSSKMNIWIATFPEGGAVNTRGFWDVAPMYDSRYVKAENQPFWILLRWGDAPWKRFESPEH